MNRMTTKMSVAAAVAALALGTAGIAQAKHGADDPAGHKRGADDVQPHKKHGADDRAGHKRHHHHARHRDDGPNHR